MGFFLPEEHRHHFRGGRLLATGLALPGRGEVGGRHWEHEPDLLLPLLALIIILGVWETLLADDGVEHAPELGGVEAPITSGRTSSGFDGRLYFTEIIRG